MASTLSNAALTVTVTENLTLNGSNHGSTKHMTITGINEVSKRIVTALASTDSTQIYAGAATTATGAFVTSNVKYIRITNLDDTYPVVLSFSNGADHHAQFSLAAGQIFIVTDTSGSFDNNAAIHLFSGEDITQITAMGVGGTVDIEILVASS